MQIKRTILLLLLASAISSNYSLFAKSDSTTNNREASYEKTINEVVTSKIELTKNYAHKE